MRKIKGNNRIVFLTNSYVFKFPRFSFLWAVIKIIFKLGVRLRWAAIPNSIKHDWIWFKRCFQANTSEYRCWKTCRAPFLVPTVFGFGFLNIQKFEKGEMPTQEEMNILVHKIYGPARAYLGTVDPHCLQEDNFVKNDKGYRMVDYGDSSDQQTTISEYIIQWHKEITPIFCATTTS